MTSQPTVTAVVSAQDQASPVLKEIAGTLRKLASQFQNLKIDDASAVGSLNRITSATRKSTAEAERNLSVIHQISGAWKAAAGALAAYTGIKLHQLEHRATHTATDLQSERTRMQVAGMPDRDIDDIEAQSRQLTGRFKNVGIEQAMELGREARSILLHPEELKEALPWLVQASSALNSQDPSGGLTAGLQQLLKGGEVAGIAQHGDRLHGFIESAVKALQVTGKTLNPEAIGELLKYEKTAGLTLSDRFNMTTGLSLAQEMGGSSAGVGIDQALKQIAGGFQGSQHAALKEWARLGLVNPDDLEKTKTGSIKGLKPGTHVDGAQLAQKDLAKWTYEKYVPALERAGITGLDDQLSMVRRTFTSSRAADIIAKLIAQRESFENHAKLYDAAQGLNATDTFAKSAATGIQSLNKSLDDLLGTLASPGTGPMGGALDSISETIRSLTEKLKAFQTNNPTGGLVLTGLTAAVTTAVQGGLALGSVALLTSAWSLKGSAVALTGAAEKLALSGKIPGAIPAATGAATGAAVEAAVGSTAAAASVAGAVAVGGAALALAATNAVKSNPEAFKGSPDEFGVASEVFAPSLPGPKDNGPLGSWGSALIENAPQVAEHLGTALSGLTKAAIKIVEGRYGEALPPTADSDSEDRANALGNLGRRWGGRTPQLPTESRQPQQVDVKSDVSGEANVYVKVDVDSNGILRVVGDMVKTAVMPLRQNLGQTLPPGKANSVGHTGGAGMFKPTLSGY